MSDHQTARVKYLADINQRTLPESTDPDCEIRYLDISGVGRGVVVAEPEMMTFAAAPSRARRLVRDGDTIVSTVRTYLRAVLSIRDPDPTLVVSTGFAVITPRSDVDPNYFAWVVQSDSFVEEIVARSVGVSYPAINASEIGDIRVPVVGLTQQRAIADYLDTETARIDALIAKKQRMVDLLSFRAEAVLLEEALGRLVDAPRVPVKRLAQKMSVPASPDDEILTAYRDGEVTARSARRADGYTLADDESGYQHVEKGDFVFHGLDGFAGATGVAAMSGKSTPVYHVCKMLGDNDARFLALQIRALAKSGYLELQASSVRQRAVDLRNWDRFGSVEVAVVPPHTQRDLVSLIDREQEHAAELTRLLKRQLDLLREHRQALITAAVTGELEIPEVAA